MVGHPPSRQKEADSIKIGPWPANVPTYAEWRLVVIDEVVAASARPDDAFTWISSVKEGTSHEELQSTDFPFRRPMGFEALDAKLSSALSKNLSGEFGRKVIIVKHQAVETGRRLSGRQLLRAIDQRFKTAEADGAVYGTERLLSASMKHDNLERFMADWDTVLTGMRKRPKDQILEAIFKGS